MEREITSLRIAALRPQLVKQESSSSVPSSSVVTCSVSSSSRLCTPREQPANTFAMHDERTSNSQTPDKENRAPLSSASSQEPPTASDVKPKPALERSDGHAQLVVIDTAGDILLRVLGMKMPGHILDQLRKLTGRQVNDQTDGQTIQYKVSRAVLIEHSPSFAEQIKPGQTEVLVKEPLYHGAVWIWLHLLHNEGTDEAWGVSQAAPWVIYEALYVARCFRFDEKLLTSWFDKCMERHYKPERLTERTASELLFLLFRFNKPQEFMEVTKFLVFNVRHKIDERNPTNRRGFRLPHRVIDVLNAAKSGLRSSLQKKLMEPVSLMLYSKHVLTPCGSKTFSHYMSDIFDTVQEWPLEDMYKNFSLAENLRALKRFNYTREPMDCGQCSNTYKVKVDHAIRYTEEVFDGLCLDCINRSDPDHGSIDEYFEGYKTFQYSARCRVSHDEKTWYFSYLGRPDEFGRRIQVERGARPWPPPRAPESTQ